MNEIVFDVCRVVATIAGLVVAYYIIPALKVVVQNHLDENITGFISACVYAAQQTLGQEPGYARKEYVDRLVTDWLNERGIKITEEQLDVLIESAVLAMKTETGK